MSPSSQQSQEEEDDVMDTSASEEQDSVDKRIAVFQNTSICNTFMSQIPQENRPSVVFWKFFNPGTRTFLELVGGRLQIIGSRRIQMLIEGLPPGSKLTNAHLYVQKTSSHPGFTNMVNTDQELTQNPSWPHSYEMIENCLRCRENGIPNVFCVLPRRGREYDFPWFTFRITCTSTAKHWRGSPFWIGAEFVTDPMNPQVIKVFSPAIHVQSKVKSKDLMLEEQMSSTANTTTPSSPLPVAQSTPSRSSNVVVVNTTPQLPPRSLGLRTFNEPQPDTGKGSSISTISIGKSPGGLLLPKKNTPNTVVQTTTTVMKTPVPNGNLGQRNSPVAKTE